MTWTWEEAREKERRFFGHEPWKQFKDHLGIANLTEALSAGLARLIDARCGLPKMTLTCRLPSLRKELMSMKREVHSNLDRLPQSFSDDPQTKLLGLCGDFVSEIGEHASGTPKHPKFLKDLHQLFWKLSKEIAQTQPIFDIPTKEQTAIAPSPLYIPLFGPVPSAPASPPLDNTRSE